MSAQADLAILLLPGWAVVADNGDDSGEPIAIA